MAIIKIEGVTDLQTARVFAGMGADIITMGWDGKQETNSFFEHFLEIKQWIAGAQLVASLPTKWIGVCIDKGISHIQCEAEEVIQKNILINDSNILKLKKFYLVVKNIEEIKKLEHQLFKNCFLQMDEKLWESEIPKKIGRDTLFLLLSGNRDENKTNQFTIDSRGKSFEEMEKLILSIKN